MSHLYTKASAQRLLPFAKKIEAIREFKNCIQVTYWCNGGRCSTFLSKTAFLKDYDSSRQARSHSVEVVKVHEDKYVVRSKGNHYTVCLSELLPASERCECPDCYYRGNKCKHQIAVEQFISQQFTLSA
jgi:hypothetical protein